MFGFLACVEEIKTNAKSEKYISVCSDRQAASKALQAAENNVPNGTRNSVGVFGFPDILEYVKIKLPMVSQGRVQLTSLLDHNRHWGLEAE